MNNKLLVGLITGGAIASTVASVYAFSSNNVDSVKSALANNDYSAWQTAITDSPNADELSTIDESKPTTWPKTVILTVPKLSSTN